MFVRQLQPADIPSIVNLLKSSLGESLLPKSEDYWRWKHIKNPFGESPVLVAIEENEIIGVRALMRWNWTYKGQLYTAVRAVDTATHPLHQGKGIFKKLTLQLLEHCKAARYRFVFNTPNDSSKPGYLKMGWNEAGKLPINICIGAPLGIFSGSRVNGQPDDDSSMSQLLTLQGLDSVINQYKRDNQSQLITDYSKSYLQWRYLQVPVVKYHAIFIEKDNSCIAFAIFRIKKSLLGKEMRITELMCPDESVIPSMRKLIRRKANEHQATFITTATGTTTDVLGWMRLTDIRVGPVVTVKNIFEMQMNMLNRFCSWQPSIGDLELF
jgi:predicted acetyltransferase